MARATPRRSGLDLRPRLGRRQARQVDPGLAEGLGVGGVGARAVRVVGLGRADVDQPIEQASCRRSAASQPGLDLGPQGGKLSEGLGVATGRPLGLLHGRQRDLPAGDVLGLRVGLVAERRRLADHPGHRGGSAADRCSLLEYRTLEPAQRRDRQHRGRQRELDLAPPPLLDRPRHGHGPLALGRLHPFLNARQVGRDPLGHDVGVIAAGPRARPPGSPWPGRSARPRPRSRPAGRGHRPCRLWLALRRISLELRPVKAGEPVRISQRIEPSANTSARSLIRSVSPRACSGAM